MKRSIHQALTALLSLVLVACGGGGGTALQLPGVSGYTLTVTPSATTASAALPVTLQIALRSPTGAPVTGATVSLVTNVGRLNVSSVQTDGAGTAQALVFAGSNGQASGELTVSYLDPDHNLSFRTIALATMGDEPTGTGSTPQTSMTLTVLGANGNPSDSSNKVTDTAPGTLRATILDANNNPVPNIIVNFSVDSIASISQSSALTDASGQASVVVTAVASGAGNVRASANVAGLPLTAISVIATQVGSGGVVTPVQVALTAYDASGVVANSGSPVTDVPGTLDALVTNNGVAVPNARVTFTVTPEVTLTQMSALTDSTGHAKVPVKAVANGAATATATVGTVVGSTVFAAAVGAGAGTATVIDLQVRTATGVSSDADNPVTAAPGSLVATVTRGGVAQAGVLVTFGTSNVAELTQTTALTNASGQATVAIAAKATGAGTATASATVASVAVNAARDFATAVGSGSGATPQLSLQILVAGNPVSTGNPVSAATPGTMRATVVDAAGAAVPNAVVSFSLVQGSSGATLGQTQALTNALGIAEAPITATATGAGTVRAASTVGTVAVNAQAPYATSMEPVADPAFTLEARTVGGVLVDAANPLTDVPSGTLTAMVRDASGAGIPNVIVTFSADNIAALAQSSALTNAAGIAQVGIVATAGGAGQVRASATVNDRLISVSRVIATSVTMATTRPTISVEVTNSSGVLADVNNPVSDSAAGTVTATVRDASGNAAPNVLVTFSVAGGVASLVQQSALTNAAGIAEVAIVATADGAGSVTATATVSAVEITQSAVFATLTGQVPVDAPILTIQVVDGAGFVINAANPLTASSPATVVVRALKADGTPATDIVVQLAVDPIAQLAQSSALTDTNGEVRIALTALSTGAGTVSASTSVGGQALSASAVIAVQRDAASTSPVVTLEVRDSANVLVTSANPITDSAPGTLTALVTVDGVVQPNVLVTFTSGAVASLLQETALTDATGRAVVGLRATATGAGQASASVTVGAVSVTTSAVYAAAIAVPVFDTPTLALAIVDDLNNRIGALNPITETKPGIMRATITQGDGTPIPDVLVKFELVSGDGADLDSSIANVQSVAYALTNAAGVAQAPIYANAGGAGTVQASATVGNSGVGNLANYETRIIGSASKPTITLQVLRGGLPVDAINQISDTSPGVMRALVADQAGVPLPGVIVNFEVDGTVAAVSQKTALTDGTGHAEVPVIATASGAGYARVYATVDTREISASQPISTIVGGTATGPVVTLLIRAADGNPVSSTNTITNLSPGTLVATVSESGTPLPGTLVTFTVDPDLATLSQVTALTNAAGVATVSITAVTSGAGPATATAVVGIVEVDDTEYFATSVGSASVDTPVMALDVLDAANNPVTATNPISNTSPGWLRATLTVNGIGRPGVVVNFALGSGAGAALPQLSALTDGNGVATVPINSVAAGAGTVIASAVVSGVDAISEKAYATTIETPPVLVLDLGNITGGVFTPDELATDATGAVAPGSAVTVFADVVDTATTLAYTDQVNITFRSICSVQGKAEIDATVTAVNGRALAIYRPVGCVGSDVITATLTTPTQTLTASVTVQIAAENVGNIAFLSAEPKTLALKGTGGAGRLENSVVRFRVVGEQGSPLSGKPVCFGLSTTAGGITLSPERATSNAAGEVAVTVLSGNVPTPVRVNAYVDDNGTCADAKPLVLVQTVSDELRISTGLPHQRSFALSTTPPDQNFPAFTYQGIEWNARVFVADRYNNPVPTGTAVNFWTESGAIVPSCVTEEDGTCSVTWRSQLPNDSFDARDRALTGMPFRDRRGRSTILAYAVGEESFVDVNGNGRWDAPEPYTDLGEVIRDTNQDDVNVVRILETIFFEEYVDFNGNGAQDFANGVFDGVLCGTGTLGATCSGDATVHVRAYSEIVMSTNMARVYFVRPDVDLSNVDFDIDGVMTGIGYTNDPNVPAAAYTLDADNQVVMLNASGGANRFAVIATDSNGNSLAAGTVIQVSTNGAAGSMDGLSTYEVSLATSLADWFAAPFTLKAPTTIPTGLGTVTVTIEHTDSSKETFSLLVDWR